MKNEYISKSIVLLFAILTTGLISAQTERKTHTIVLECDLKIIEDDLEKACTFGQDKSSISNEDYTIDVEVGDLIIWIGRTKNEGKIIDIEEFKHIEGKKVFGENRLKSRRGIISAYVTEGDKGQVEKYDLVFKVPSKGRMRSNKFTIDPRIRIIK